jgi:hypothetical protein
MRALRVIGAAMAVVITMGCSFAGVRFGSASSSPSPSPGPVYPTGWSKVDVSVSHFTIGLPNDWPRVRTDPKYFESDMAKAKSESSTAASTFTGFMGGSNNFASALVAADASVNVVFVAASYPAQSSDTLGGITNTVINGFVSSAGSDYTQGTTTNRKIAVGAAEENQGTLLISGTTFEIRVVGYILPASHKPRFYYAFLILAPHLSTYDTDFSAALDTFRPV